MLFIKQRDFSACYIGFFRHFLLPRMDECGGSKLLAIPRWNEDTRRLVDCVRLLRSFDSGAPVPLDRRNRRFVAADD